MEINIMTLVGLLIELETLTGNRVQLFSKAITSAHDSRSIISMEIKDGMHNWNIAVQVIESDDVTQVLVPGLARLCDIIKESHDKGTE